MDAKETLTVHQTTVTEIKFPSLAWSGRDEWRWFPTCTCRWSGWYWTTEAEAEQQAAEHLASS
jgi:hypothetical protein